MVSKQEEAALDFSHFEYVVDESEALPAHLSLLLKSKLVSTHWKY